MTGAEILLMANLHTEGDTISNAEGLMYINEWLLMDLGGDAGIVDSADVDTVATKTTLETTKKVDTKKVN